MTAAPDTLCFLTCGSVDDGKSTLLGRLLYDSNLVFTDHLDALVSDSRRHGTQGDRPDLALLLDGLRAEREQGITIDVAYRYFNTPRRRFVAVDAPGHEQYTRNMATGASNAQLAILLVEAAAGPRTQTFRHARIAFAMGIRHLVLAVNKMDLVGYDREFFDRAVAGVRKVVGNTNGVTVQAIPISALHGDNVIVRSAAMPWYEGPPLLEYLEEVPVRQDGPGPFRMPVQWINRPRPDFRGLSGRIAGGQLRVGMPVAVLPSGASAVVEEILVGFDAVDTAETGDCVTVRLDRDLDVARGSLLTIAAARPAVATELRARLLWLNDSPLTVGQPYKFRLHTCETSGTVRTVAFREDFNTGERVDASSLSVNELGAVTVSLSNAVPFDPFSVNPRLGAFVLIDRLTKQTMGAGMIEGAADPASPIRWQNFAIDKRTRSDQKGQRPVCIWFTGLPASGKSTIANAVEQRLYAFGRHTYVLDGDNVRHGLSRDLGFAETDRSENVRRAAEVARLMVDAGLIVLVCFISPFRRDRDKARALFGPGEFLEVFVDAPLAVCQERDPKKLYQRAREGAVTHLTGVDALYEPPASPQLRLDTAVLTVDQCALRVTDLIS